MFKLLSAVDLSLVKKTPVNCSALRLRVSFKVDMMQIFMLVTGYNKVNWFHPNMSASSNADWTDWNGERMEKISSTNL
ncbi:hypothetical protein BpHYR1_027652 [Brachionus plicatilis]|uniref:Uncharacterized protein n=1 Tax=Brachionus plicatilis TaxID=10195 RepID=A0A3M7S3V5_BRAPC|nr:hypothetical protein BpHYR1_027652 [Brachionus plicatilis]